MTKILIVDDESMMLMVTKRILSKKYEVVCASSGAEGIELYESEKPDMILSDLLMPQMSGFEMHKILQDKYGRHIPIMFMTADESDETDGKGFELGAEDFIRKPFHPDVLLKRVGNILNNIERIQSLTEEATTDALTGFLNKTGTNNELARACKTMSGALLVIDLDNFKLVNDIFGHEAGDKVLTAFAEIIRENLHSDDIVGRIGGDEFAAFCASLTDEKAVAGTIRRINEQLLQRARAVIGDEMTIPLGVSAGAVFVPRQGNDYEMLFGMADKALYFVKQNEKHGYSVYSAGCDDSEKPAESPDDAFSRISLILEERNMGNSAFWLGQDAFGNVYRFMMRYIQSYHGTAYKALFTLNPKINMRMAEFAAVAEQFGHILNCSLRKSDVMMQYRTNQFFLLLPEITDKDINSVIDRIKRQWEQNEFSSAAEPEYKIESICAEELDERERRRK